MGFMRFIIGFLSGVLGMLAGWLGLAFLVTALAGPDRDGGIAMGAVFNIGPIGGVAGFIAGVWLFIKFGQISQQVSQQPSQQVSQQVSQGAASPDAERPGAAPIPARTRVSPVFAAAVVAVTAGLAWWGWYELIRSPYLTRGFMTLELQFRLPPGMALPPDEKDVHIAVEEGGQHAIAMLAARWRASDGDRKAIIAKASLSLKTSRRIVHLELPGVAEQTWTVDLPSDPDPTPGFSPWLLPRGNPAPKIEMHFRLSAER